MMSHDHERGVLVRWSAGMVLAGVLLMSACEGSNLFVGEVTEDAPRVTSLTGPASVNAGAVLTVQVAGTAPRGVRIIEVRFSGAAVDTVTVDFPTSNTSASTSAEVTVGQGTGSQVFVNAFVQDINGRNSAIVSIAVAVN
ncbi:MAG: hypothetical protein ACRELT_19075 [Longimicrobiales bacterium]